MSIETNKYFQKTNKGEDNPRQESYLDFATIQGDMSCLCDNFPEPISSSDYLVTETVLYERIYTESDIVRRQSIQPGDRVIVAWVSNQLTIIGRFAGDI